MEKQIIDSQPPWADGPGELLRHGLELISHDTDSSRRVAMILIDNAVELMIGTYLKLPKRINKINISRKQIDEIGESFSNLIDALEKYAQKQVMGIDFGSIEWYHRLRNQLYHQGNGLTIERTKVELYAEMANQLYKRLFSVELVVQPVISDKLLGEFIRLWGELETSMWSIAHNLSFLGQPRNRSIKYYASAVKEVGLITSSEWSEIENLRRLRNDVLHGKIDYKVAITPIVVSKMKEYVSKLEGL